MKHIRSTAMAITASLILAASCVSASKPTPPPSPPTAAPAVAAASEELLVAPAEASGSAPQPPEALPAPIADPLEAAAPLVREGEEASAAPVGRATEAERSGKDEAPAAADELRMRQIKESLLAFPERMGEVFARAPSPSSKLSDKELLAFNEETARIISSGLSDFDRMLELYPDLIDPSTAARLRETAKGFSARFARIDSTIRSIKDRGKPLIPLIIGIFNPQPGDPQRSRPASFAGRLSGGSDWWWGIADIPQGLAQDLVVTMNDSRPVRVYAAGLGSSSKRPASDLVNPLFKVGNSWPVLNAGARLENGVFHIEVGPARAEGYAGDAVVYKSFMTRTR